MEAPLGRSLALGVKSEQRQRHTHTNKAGMVQGTWYRANGGASADATPASYTASLDSTQHRSHTLAIRRYYK